MQKKQTLKGIFYFFIGMCVCTFLARQASYMTVAKVHTEKMKSGNLVKRIEGSGEVRAADKSYQSLPEEQKIGKILVKSGIKVEKGTAVVQLDMEYLKRKITEQRRETEKAELELEQQKLTARHEQKRYEQPKEGGEDPKEPDDERTKKQEREEKEYQKKLASMQQEALELTLKSQREKLQRLENFWNAKGIVSSEYSGILETVNTTEGAITTGTEQIILESGNLEVCGMVPDTETGILKEGMEVLVRIQGNAKEQKVLIERFGVNEEGKRVWYGKLSEQEKGNIYRTKTSITYAYEEKTVGNYENLVPITALREEQNSAYVLIAEMQDGILGEQYMAEKVPVRILDRDEEYAAVQTALPSNAMIITGTNKYVEDGDRVRLEE